MTDTPKFAEAFDATKVELGAMTMNGKARSGYFRGQTVFEGVWARVLGSVKPGLNEKALGKYTKFNLTFSLNSKDPQHVAFMDKGRALERRVVEIFYQNKTTNFPDKAKYMNDPSALMGMFNPFIKDGKMKGDVQYDPTVTFKVDAAALAESLITETIEKPDGSKEQEVTGVKWKTLECKYRLVERGGKTKVEWEPYPEELPKCYLWLGENVEADGTKVDLVASKVDLKDADGNPLIDENGVKRKRWITPADIVSGCVACPIFNIKKSYLVQSFGIHAFVDSIIIKPPQPKEVPRFKAAREVEEADELAEKALKAIETVDKVVDPATEKQEAASALGNVPTFEDGEEEEPPKAELLSPSKKTKSSADAGGPPAKKPRKNVAVE